MVNRGGAIQPFQRERISQWVTGFTQIPKPKVFKDEYRELLDRAPLNEEQREALIDEAMEGFRINAALFAQLGEQDGCL